MTENVGIPKRVSHGAQSRSFGKQSILALLVVTAPAWSCGDQGAKLLNSSDQPCADKVALAMNSSQPVTGAWDCLGTTMKAAYADIGVTGDDGIAHNLNSAKYMSTVKFVGHRSLYDDTSDKRFLLYRVGSTTGGGRRA